MKVIDRIACIALIIAIIAVICAPMIAAAVFQRPTPTVIGGATTAGTAAAQLQDADGTVHVTATAGAPVTVAIASNNVGVGVISGTNALKSDLSSIVGTAALGAGSGALAVMGAQSSGTSTVGGTVNVGGATAGVTRQIVTDTAGFLIVKTSPAMATGAYVSDYTGTAGMTVLSAAGTSQFTAITTKVQSIWCNNQTAAGVLLYITDGNDVYKIGPNYTLAAGSNGALLNVPTGVTFAAGIKMSAGTANAIRCQVEGLQ